MGILTISLAKAQEWGRANSQASVKDYISQFEIPLLPRGSQWRGYSQSQVLRAVTEEAVVFNRDTTCKRNQVLLEESFLDLVPLFLSSCEMFCMYQLPGIGISA